MSSGSRKSLKTAQTRLGPPELQNLEADELDSDDDDTASVASEQFYENIVSDHAFTTYSTLHCNYFIARDKPLINLLWGLLYILL